jgi:hypothetical protein
LSLPVAVTLKRLRAPRCVFNFIFGFDAFLGIAKNPLIKGRGKSAPGKFPCYLVTSANVVTAAR